MLGSWFGRRKGVNLALAEAVYEAIVAAARQPPFYSRMEVPDTPLGRFEMLSIHMFLVQNRLRDEVGQASGVAQELIDIFFADLDDSLRELGISDMGVPKRMKRLARMFYGRTQAYDEALLAGDRAAMAAALARNVRPDAGGWPAADMLAGYVFEARERLKEQDVAAIMAGALRFPAAGKESREENAP